MTFEPYGLFIEHGHQGDPFNNHSGRKKGHVITQVVTHYPMIRDWEDPIGGGWSYLSETEPRRLQFIRHALGRVLNGSHVGIYVMGHTHHPCAKLLRIRSRNSKANALPPVVPL